MYPRRLIDENRWRASRYGIDGKLIDFGRRCEIDERDLLHEMLEFIGSEVDELGNHAEIAHIDKIMREGTGADRQLAVWEQNPRNQGGRRSHRERDGEGLNVDTFVSPNQIQNSKTSAISSLPGGH
jgi:gamma-glutamyl:cysteine ligase YbdK (ATP-grasp superfamily)